MGNERITGELKKLGQKLNGTAQAGETISDVLGSINDGFDNGNVATKSYVNTLMSGALKRSIVEELPTEDIDTNTIYMVLDETASQGNVYNEYLYIEEAWELIGTTAMEMPHLYEHKIAFISSVYGTLYAKYYDNVATPYDQTTFVAKYGVADADIQTNTDIQNNKLLYKCSFQSNNPNNIYIWFSSSAYAAQSDFITNLTDTVTQIF